MELRGTKTLKRKKIKKKMGDACSSPTKFPIQPIQYKKSIRSIGNTSNEWPASPLDS